MFNHEIIIKNLKRAAPYIGVALIFYLLGGITFNRNTDLKQLIKAQSEVLNTIRKNESQYREQQNATIKQLQEHRAYIEVKFDSLRMLDVKNAVQIEKQIKELNTFKNALHKDFSNYSDSNVSVIISRIQPKSN